MGGSWAATGDEASKFARFHFRPHFFQHAGLRMVSSVHAAMPSPAVRLSKEALSAAAAPPTTQASAVGYESDKLLSEYMMLHFGTSDDVLPFEAVPREWLGFPQRCAQLVERWAGKLGLPRGRALDIGCAVGGGPSGGGGGPTMPVEGAPAGAAAEAEDEATTAAEDDAIGGPCSSGPATT